MNTDRFKFRVWDKEKETYLEDMNLADIGGVFRISAFESLDCYSFDNVIVEQCTGLRDKNGKLIYEGDVIRSPSKRRRGEVRWCGGSTKCLSGMWVVKCAKEKMPEYFSSEWEIIGNIHEGDSK